MDESLKRVRTRTKERPEIVARAKKQIIAYYQGCRKDGTILFMTPSGTTPGLFWNQQVKLLDLRAILKKSKKNDLGKIREALAGNVSVHCDDPSYKFWGYQYIGTINKYAIKAENRKPVIRNPRLRGGTCKHLEQVLQVLPFHAAKILKDYRKKDIL